MLICRYLHDGRQPPLVHQNFEPSVVLLNSTLAVQISECGLASLSQVNNDEHICIAFCKTLEVVAELQML